MRTRICVAVVVAILASACISIAQEDAPKRWEDWHPPEVQMPDPNAWAIYQRAFEIEEQVYQRLREEAGLPPEVEDADEPVEVRPPGVDLNLALKLHMTERSLEPERLEELVRAYTPVFSALEAAIAGETQIPPARSSEDFETIFPDFADMRQACRMFASRSVYHRRNDDALSAALDAIAAIRVGADVGTHGSMIASLTEYACVAIGESQLREAIPLLGPDEAKIVATDLRAAMNEMPGFAAALRGEENCTRLLMRENFPQWKQVDQMVQRLREDPDYARQVLAQEDPAVADLDDEAVKALVEEKIEQMEALKPEEAWAEIGRFYGALQAEAEKDLWERETVDPPDNIMLAQLVSSFERAGLKFAYTEARLRVALASAAAQTFKGDTGAYPPSLGQLVPEYLPEIPRDPYMDAPLRTVAHDPVSRAHPGSHREPTGAGVLTIYSVGPDGDDDNGVEVGRDWDIEADGDISLTLGGG